jgi:multicomponent K+:H+ antiporter subunit C
MELLVASAIGLMTAAGVYLVLRARTFPVVLGLNFLTYAVNVFIFASGGLRVGEPPVVGAQAGYADPLPQALVLTAIVISFGMTAYLIVLAMQARAATDSDHVDAGAAAESVRDAEDA